MRGEDSEGGKLISRYRSGADALHERFSCSALLRIAYTGNGVINWRSGTMHFYGNIYWVRETLQSMLGDNRVSEAIIKRRDN